MIRMLITQPIHASTIAKLNLYPSPRFTNYRGITVDLSDFGEVMFSGDADMQVLYVPAICERQQAREEFDPTIAALGRLLWFFAPHILVAGDNAVPGFVQRTWRLAIGSVEPLLIIRRGVDMRAIDRNTARELDIEVKNLSGIDSPYIAQHLMGLLDLENQPKSHKLAIMGVGNVGSLIAQRGVKLGLKVSVYSATLANPESRYESLLKKGLLPETVHCGATVHETLQDADLVVVALPLFTESGKSNAGMIADRDVSVVHEGAKIFSCSTPQIFTPEALNLMHVVTAKNEISVRFDTAIRNVLQLREDYPGFSAFHDVAGAHEHCQEALDFAFLNLVAAHIRHLENQPRKKQKLAAYV